MEYEADIPNFFEPWYGIGPVASSFGIDYIWSPRQAPSTKPAFQTIDEALVFDIRLVKNTEVGKHLLQMIEYFLVKEMEDGSKADGLFNHGTEQINVEVIWANLGIRKQVVRDLWRQKDIRVFSKKISADVP